MKIEQQGGIHVLRDDLLPGGTKSILLPHLITEPREYVYASPVYGGFQIALAEYCAGTKSRATIFCAERKRLHPNTVRVIEAGAKVVEVKAGYLSNVEKKARDYCERTGAIKLPFGVNTKESVKLIADRMRAVIERLGFEPDEVWCAVGSGTLLQGILHGTTRAMVNGVVVGAAYVFPHRRVKLRVYPKPFEAECKAICPFPSMPNYDLKAWQFCRAYSRGERVLFWNVL